MSWNSLFSCSRLWPEIIVRSFSAKIEPTKLTVCDFVAEAHEGILGAGIAPPVGVILGHDERLLEVQRWIAARQPRLARGRG